MIALYTDLSNDATDCCETAVLSSSSSEVAPPSEEAAALPLILLDAGSSCYAKLVDAESALELDLDEAEMLSRDVIDDPPDLLEAEMASTSSDL